MKTVKKILIGLFFVVVGAIGIYNVYRRNVDHWNRWESK